MKVNLDTLRSVKETAALLGVGTTRVKQWVGEDRLAAKLVGGALVIPQESIDRLDAKRLPQGRPKKISEKSD